MFVASTEYLVSEVEPYGNDNFKKLEYIINISKLSDEMNKEALLMAINDSKQADKTISQSSSLLGAQIELRKFSTDFIM